MFLKLIKAPKRDFYKLKPDFWFIRTNLCSYLVILFWFPIYLKCIQVLKSFVFNKLKLIPNWLKRDSNRFYHFTGLLFCFPMFIVWINVSESDIYELKQIPNGMQCDGNEFSQSSRLPFLVSNVPKFYKRPSNRLI